MSEKTKKQNRGTKFAWFACLAFALAFGFGFFVLILTMPFNGSETAYAFNTEFLSAPIFLGFGGSVILFLLFRLCTCGFKKASRVYRINIISMLLLLIALLVIYGLCVAGFLPMMIKNEKELLDGIAASNVKGHGFLALFTGYNDWLIWITLFSPILFLAIYVLMYILMVKAAKEVRADIKAVKAAKRDERNAKIKAEKEKKEAERIALETQREEERKRLEEERAKKEEERKALAEQKEAERLVLEEQRKAEKEAKAQEAAEKKAMAMASKVQVAAAETPETSAETKDLAKELLDYQRRKESLRPAYFTFLIVSLPIFILQILCVPALVDSGQMVEIGDFGALSLFIAFVYFVLNLVFILIGAFNTKRMTLSLRVLVFSSIGAQLGGMLINLIVNLKYGGGMAGLIPTIIFLTVSLALLIVSIILLSKYKENEKIKNYISIGSLGLLIVLEAIFSIFPQYAFLAIHPGYAGYNYWEPTYNFIPNVIIAVILCGLVFPLIFFSKRLAEGYVLSKTLPAPGKKPRAMTDEEKLEALQKDCKTATKEGDTAKVAALNAEILELTEKIKNNPRGTSTFDGRLIQLIGYRLLGILITGITFGIGYPWAKCFVERWSVKHLVVDGKRLSFDGKGVQLLGKFILWVFLTIITFGIFSFWFAIKMKKWTASHSHIEGNENPAESKSTFDGRLIQLIGYNLLSFLMTVFTLGIAYPWAKCLKENWGVKHTIVDGKRLEFDGRGVQLFGKYIVWFILTIITFGIYGLWLSIKMKKWVASHTHFEAASAGEDLGSQEVDASTSEPEAKEIPEQPSTKENTTWICPNCKVENKGKFCSECGAPKPEDKAWICPNCKTENKGKFCSECGTPKPDVQ